jgi:hypothetical protein
MGSNQNTKAKGSAQGDGWHKEKEKEARAEQVNWIPTSEIKLRATKADAVAERSRVIRG